MPPPPSTVKRPFLEPVVGRHCFAAVILSEGPEVAVDDMMDAAAGRELLAVAAVPVPGRGAMGRGARGRNRPDADEVVD
jgi:hypothetical protein